MWHRSLTLIGVLTVCSTPIAVAAAMQAAGFPMRKNSRGGEEFNYAQKQFDLVRLEGDRFTHLAVRKNNIALIRQELGDFAAAEEAFHAALGAAEFEEDKLLIRFNLGRLYQDMTDYERAEPLMSSYLAALAKSKFIDVARLAEVECDVAWLQVDMGDYAAAERLFLQARRRIEAAEPRDVPSQVAVLHNLALLYEKLGRRDDAEALLGEAIQVAKVLPDSVQGPRAHLWETLGFLHLQNEKLESAEQPLKDALAYYRDTFGDEHRSTARVTNNLGFLYARRGEHDKAEPLLNEAAATRRKLFGEEHGDYIDTLDDLAALLDSKGRRTEAVRLMDDVLVTARKKLDLTAAVQSERQQLLMTEVFRQHLDHYLSLSDRAGTSAGKVYEHVFVWKGSVFARQRCARLTAATDPKMAAARDEYRRVAGEISVLLDAAPPADQRKLVRERIDELMLRRERLEREIFSTAATSRAAAQRLAGTTATPQRLFAALDSGAVLVDFLSYEYSEPVEGRVEAGRERRIVAFVVDSTGVRQRIELGSEAEIENAVDAWRAGLGRNPASRAAASQLRQSIWMPLEPHLGKAEVILISPDGALGRLPLTALPGVKADSYLLEERTLVTVPVPRVLAETPERGPADKLRDFGDVLLVGGIDYESAATQVKASASRKTLGRRPQRGADWKLFTPLDGAKDEITLIGKMFLDDAAGGWKVTTLENRAADESRFAHEAVRHRYLHIATHGFFAPPQLRTALDGDDFAASPSATEIRSGVRSVGRSSGLLSGLALAGANREPVPGQDDGILTAEEVQTLDLSGVEMAVLSACDTGLGDVAGGEGVLGLQRAFQMAGARTTIATLWKIDDLQTRAVMTQFYRNLLGGEMSTAEALRQAQLSTLRNGPKRDVRLGEAQVGDAATQSSPPYFWAPFILSGDWR